MESANIYAHPAGNAFRIRPMAERDLSDALQLLELAGWPHRLRDLTALFEVGEGIIIEAGDAMVGMGMRWLWGAKEASVGLFAEHPSWRGHGVSEQLMNALCTGLEHHSVRMQLPLPIPDWATRLGFVHAGDISRIEGRAALPPLVALPDGYRLRPAGRKDLALLTRLDTAATGMARKNMLASWQPSALAAMVLDHPDGAQGFALMRRFGRGAVIGPVIAPCTVTAKALIAHLAAMADGRFLRLDVLNAPDLRDWIVTLGLEQTGHTAVLVKGGLKERQPPRWCVVLADETLG